MPNQFIDIAILLSLLVLGYFFGRRAEKKHFESILEREHLYQNILTFSERLPPPQLPAPNTQLVSGNVVVTDFLGVPVLTLLVCSIIRW